MKCLICEEILSKRLFFLSISVKHFILCIHVGGKGKIEGPFSCIFVFYCSDMLILYKSIMSTWHVECTWMAMVKVLRVFVCVIRLLDVRKNFIIWYLRPFQILLKPSSCCVWICINYNFTEVMMFNFHFCIKEKYMMNCLGEKCFFHQWPFLHEERFV